MRRLRTRTGRGLLVVALLLAATGIGGYIFVRGSLATVSGEVHLDGINGEIDIVRDANAVPHISASTPADAYFGLGYSHAQDRLWQMEFQRRVGMGRLSEVLGSASLSADRVLRTLGVGGAAQADWQSLRPDAKSQITAYIDGINALIDTHSGNALPPEFTILGVAPEHWTGPDVLVWMKMMALGLGGDYETEMLRQDLVEAVGPKLAEQLLPGYPKHGVSIMRTWTGGNMKAAATPAPQADALGGPDGLGLGSNSWVVDGTRTTTGEPILANDLHLEISMPAMWYLAHLSAGDLDVEGATIPGLPGVIIGRNRSITWAITNFPADVQDLYKERLSEDGRSAEINGKMEPLQLTPETIKVRGKPDVQMVVRVTRHGPIVSDPINANDAAKPVNQRPRTPMEPMSLRWTALDPNDTTAAALFDINNAHDWGDFQNALRGFVAPTLNFLYADTGGNIGYYAAGRVPVRAGGDGSLPSDGWSAAHDWTASIAFADMPHTYNPPEHFIVAANNRPVEQGYPYQLGDDWAPPERAQRITDLLSNHDVVSPDDMARMQNDTVSLVARDLTPELLALVTPVTPAENQALDLLRSWNGDVRADSAAAAIYEVWSVRLTPALVGSRLGPQLTDRYLSSRFVEDTLAHRNSPWCDQATGSLPQDCAMLARSTLDDALAELSSRLGSNMSAWRWDALHTAVFPHPIFDAVDILRPLFDRTLPTAGDTSTVDVGGFSHAEPYSQTIVAGYRQIIDLSDPSNDRFIQATGQSGDVLSSHYDDYLADWQAGHYRKTFFEHEQLEQNTRDTLRLLPR
jgi:penicillin amidase